MRLFGSQKTVQTPSLVENGLDIHKIPDAFYGGNNPVIYEQVSTSKSKDVTRIAPAISTPSSPGASKRRFPIIVIVGFLGILVIGGASAYYILQYRAARNSTMSNPPVETSDRIPVIPSISQVNSTQTTSTISSSTIGPAPTTTPSLISNFLEFPSVNLANSADVDLDQLTDIEEALFGIDSGTWDTDVDGYYDGQELINLYNPRGAAPVKLIDSGLVREYVNPFSEYRLYYPLQWQKGAVDPEEKQVLLSSIGGEFIEIRVFQKNSGDTFSQWFQANAPDQQFNLLTSFTNRFGVEGFKRSDGLVVYFDTSSFVFVILYHQPESTAPIPYRSTMQMVYQSFRPTATTRTIPEQVPIQSSENLTSTPNSVSSTSP